MPTDRLLISSEAIFGASGVAITRKRLVTPDGKELDSITIVVETTVYGRPCYAEYHVVGSNVSITVDTDK